MEEVCKPVSVGQIAEALDLDCSLLHHTIKVLLKHKEVGFFELDRIAAADFLGIEKVTRRMKFYFDVDLIGQFQDLQ